MISPAHARLMAAYNEWQNESLYGAASGLTDVARREDRGEAADDGAIGIDQHPLLLDFRGLGGIGLHDRVR